MFFLSWLTARGSGIGSVCFNTDTLSPVHTHYWLIHVTQNTSATLKRCTKIDILW